MIAALCANPCVDRTVSIEKFVYGGMNRIQSAREDGSGKGVNVALACRQLGLDAVCLGFMPLERDSLILDRLAAGGSGVDFVRCPGAVRLNTKVLDQSTGVITEINESGPAVGESHLTALTESVLKWVQQCSFLVLTGSTPPGCPTGFYRELIESVRRSDAACRVVLDAEGQRFTEGLLAKPYLVKPNRYELELLCGRPLPTVRDIHGEAQKLIDGGVGLVAVSMGGDGAYMTDGRDSFYAPALKVEVRSTVGAGDSMVAGLLYGLEAGNALETVFRCGMAAAASSVTTEGTGLINPDRFHAFLEQIDIRRI